MLLDIFEYLDRLCLEKLQHVCKRFRWIIDSRMTEVCFRVINTVHVQWELTTAGKCVHCKDSLPLPYRILRAVLAPSPHHAVLSYRTEPPTLPTPLPVPYAP